MNFRMLSAIAYPRSRSDDRGEVVVGNDEVGDSPTTGAAASMATPTSAVPEGRRVVYRRP